jgi:CelD/BcsL family acetyltransferase involved in cellulose biosynthesis
MNIRIFENDEARELLESREFLLVWEKLWQACSWATVFQGPTFVRAWYRNFPAYPCIIVTDWKDGAMAGLLTLTKDGDNLVAAGTNLAEYQVWLATRNSNHQFISSALLAIQECFPKVPLKLKYLPPTTPLDCLRDHKWCSFVLLKPYEMPLMRLDKTNLQLELKKKNRKEKLNRLKRIGELSFKVLKENDSFEKVIEEMCVQSDFRKGAMYNKTAFKDEPERKKFLLALYGEGLIHLSVYSVNQDLIASNAGIIGGNMVHLQGINAHSPFYAKHSPGILHFLQLGIALSEEGYAVFDLTPGGAGGYKDMLATEHQTAWELNVLPAQKIKLLKAIDVSKQLLIKLLGKYKARTSSGELKLLLINYTKKGRLMLQNPMILFQSTSFNSLWSSASKKYFTFSDYPPTVEDNRYNIHQSNLRDFLKFKEQEGLITRWEFLGDCMKRMELGHIPYTINEKNALVGVFWEINTNVKSGELNQGKFERVTFAYSYYNKVISGHLRSIATFIISKHISPKPDILPYDIQVASNQKGLLQELKKTGNSHSRFT